MSWLGLILLVVCAWLAYKLVGALLKIAMLLLALVGAYWFLAPHLGWPTVSELVYVLGPDFGGRRIEEVAAPAELARLAKDRVVEGVVESVAGHLDAGAPVPLEESPQASPENVEPAVDEPQPD